MNWVYVLMALDLGLYLWYLSDPHNVVINAIESFPLITGLNAFFALLTFVNLPWLAILGFLAAKGRDALEEAV